IIDLPDDQVAALSKICETEGISRAEAVRRAVAEMLRTLETVGRESAFGAWSDQVDSSTLIRTIREEWD
ncbi:MAG: CopG family transcriptional regulator, partial [Verrucomicrobiales bacterium]